MKFELNLFSGKFVSYKAQSLTQAFPKLLLIPYGEELGSLCLTLQPNLRISAKDALKHLYFSDLPNNVFDLPNSKTTYLTKLIYCQI